MKLITALFAPLEKLIIEHGSSVILSNQVSLFKDELAIIKEKFTILASENENLKTKNSDLKAENERLKSDNIQLQEKIQKYEQLSHNLTPHEIEQRIMLYLKNNPKSSIKQIAAFTGINVQQVSEALDLYRCYGGVISSFESPGSDSLWSLP